MVVNSVNCWKFLTHDGEGNQQPSQRKLEGSTTILFRSTRQAVGKRGTPYWGDDIVSSGRDNVQQPHEGGDGLASHLEGNDHKIG